MTLDIPTILVSQTVLGLFLAALLFLLWLSSVRHIHGVGWWTLALVSITLGQTLIALRGFLPLVVTMLLANMAIVAGSIALLYGVGAFLGVRLPAVYGFAIFILAGILFIFFGYFIVDVRARVVVINAVSFLNATLGTILFFRKAEASIRRYARAVGLILAALALNAVLRLFGAFAYPLSSDWISSSSWEAYSILGLIVIEVSLVFTLIALVDARLRAQLSRTADEKMLLVREMHHRTKNDFALVESLISLETGELPPGETSEALERVRNRIHSFALLHDKLYRGKTTGKVDAGEYSSLIAAGLVAGGSKDDRISLRTKVEVVETDAGIAVALGLIVNELITNAIKHAFPDGRPGTIYLSLEMVGGSARLEVKDDGIGLAATDAGTPIEGLGMTLVGTLAEQIGATMERSSARGEGVRTTLTFPLSRDLPPKASEGER